MFLDREWGNGSSPLARGTLRDSHEEHRRRGLIPARAGNTPSSRTTRSRSWAHPRSRGEHLKRFAGPVPLRGSSPLARGTRLTCTPTSKSTRLIPARAGNTSPVDGKSCPAWAHPRSRGEHGAACDGKALVAGSSPLARGTRRPLCRKDYRKGLIPARAGNT